MVQRVRGNRKYNLTSWDIGYLVFILEIQKNLLLFELTTVQYNDVSSLKE